MRIYYENIINIFLYQQAEHIIEGNDFFSVTENINNNNNKHNNNKRLLLVDDEPDVIYSIRTSLESKGFTVIGYVDPLLALQDFKHSIYDLVLLDIRMPKMDGVQLYKQIKNIDRDVVICFFSAVEPSFDEYKKICPSFEDKYFIQKPISMDSLVDRMVSILAD